MSLVLVYSVYLHSTVYKCNNHLPHAPLYKLLIYHWGHMYFKRVYYL